YDRARGNVHYEYGPPHRTAAARAGGGRPRRCVLRQQWPAGDGRRPGRRVGEPHRRRGRKPTMVGRVRADRAGGKRGRETACGRDRHTGTGAMGSMQMFKRIAVVNRGESAVRLIRAVRELNAEHGYGIQSIAMHTDAERRAMFVRQADDTVCIRPTGAGNAYLDHDALADALRRSRADAVWVGWGFVAEDPAFAEMVRAMGIAFIGPSPEAMRLLGDKVQAKLLAEKVDVPVAPWSGGPVDTRAEARRHAQTIGYPLIIKARSGGGGRGIRTVYAEDELELALDRTQGEAERSFGDPVA